MDGLEKITARISADADAEIQAIRDKAQAQAEELLAQARAQAEKEKGELLARGRRSAEERKARLISAAQMEGRKMSLAAKQEVLEAFEAAMEAQRERALSAFRDGTVDVLVATDVLARGIDIRRRCARCRRSSTSSCWPAWRCRRPPPAGSS